MQKAKSSLIVRIVLLVAAAAFAVPNSVASTYKVLHKFTGSPDGSGPGGGLITEASGNLYGATTDGGASGYGTVFKLAPNADGSWTESVLYSFNPGFNFELDGGVPLGGLIFDGAGNLYGTTRLGGRGGPEGLGAVFKLAPNADGSWTESVLHYFTGGSDGGEPTSGVIFDGAGNLYGTTTLGVTIHGRLPAVVFKLTPTTSGEWTYSVLQSFTGGGDGGDLLGSLVFDAAGNLYGTARGGTAQGGIVFRLAPQLDGSWRETVLHNFGAEPSGSLVFDQAGNLYGTTFAGGSHGFGTVFKLTPNVDGIWPEKILRNFTGGFDGSKPGAGLVIDIAGNLYGSTSAVDSANFGVVFKMTSNVDGSWTFKALHSFQGTPAEYPSDAPLLDNAGNLYGTTGECGDRGGVHLCDGVVFKLTQ
jgi:uncharacterized repeat protein (TIGR03803 family)